MAEISEEDLAALRAATKEMRAVLEQWQRDTLQVDIGRCAICGHPGRCFNLKGKAEKCGNGSCFSNAVARALGFRKV